MQAIVLTSLAKERERRYQSAAELGQDIQRYLRNEAVQARAPSLIYQIRVFARRNKVVFASLAAVLAVLVAGIIVSTSLYFRAEHARAQQARERDLAEKARVEAEAVTTFLSDMLAEFNPSQSGAGASVRHVLDQASKTVSERFANSPLVEARLHRTIGKSYHGLGLYNEAERHLTVAVEMYRRLLGEEHLETIRSMNALTRVYYHHARTKEARELNERTEELARNGLGERHEETLMALHLKGNLMNDSGRWEGLLALRTHVLEQRRRTVGEEYPDTVGSMIELARVWGDTEKAIAVQENGLASLPEEAASRWEAEGRLATYYRSAGRVDDAARMARQRLETLRKLLERGGERPIVLNDYARDLLTIDAPDLRDPAAALPLAERACVLAEERGTYGRWKFLDTLALAQHRTGDTAKAIETQRRALGLIPPEYHQQRKEFEASLAEYEAALVGQSGDPSP